MAELKQAKNTDIVKSSHQRIRSSWLGAEAWPNRLLGVLAVLCMGNAMTLAQQNDSGRVPINAGRELRPTRVSVVATSKMILNVNYNDARAALKAWFDVVARQRGFLLDCRIDVVDSVDEIKARLHSHTVDVILPGIAEYLELESSRLVIPVMTLSLSAQGGAPYSYVLLVNPSSAATTIAALRGKNILASSRGGSNTGMAWMEGTLAKEKLGRAASFFGSIKFPAKAQECILPLFFGAADACVVDEVSLNLAKEMNPQLGKLRILARTRPLIENVIATPLKPHPYQSELNDAILSLHEDPGHRQLLMVLKTDRILRIQPGDLDSVREIWRDYYRLPGSSPNQSPGTVPAASNLVEQQKD